MTTETLEKEVERRILYCQNSICERRESPLPEEHYISPYGGHYHNEKCYQQANMYEFD